MRKGLFALLAVCLTVAFIEPALAAPGDTAPFQAGSTLAGVLTQIAQVGDDTFSTMDLSTVLANGGTPTQHYGPFPSTSPDSSTCGNNWATDAFDRHFTVRNNGNGTYEVVEQFKNGAFVTMAGASPGGCDTDVGGTIRAGVTGSLQGYEVITVTGTQSSQDSSCVATMPTLPCTTAGFIQTHFAGGFTVGTYFFHYSAGDQSLFHGEWKNASCDRGGNQGDVASTGGPAGLQKSALCP